MRRIFIDIKLIAIDDDYDSVITEIHRGSHKLVEDYDRVLNEIKLPMDIKAMLKEQKAEIVSKEASFNSISKNLIHIH